MNFYHFIKLVFLSILFSSCSTSVTTVYNSDLQDNDYDSDFFIGDDSKLDDLFSSVKMVNCFAYYKSYFFNDSAQLKKINLEENNFSTIALKQVHTTETASGTATLIYSHKGKVAFLTCAHILNFPDTLITFYKNDKGINTEFIESITIKTRQSIILPELSVSNEVKILSIDNKQDIALVGREVSLLNSRKYIPFGLTAGNSTELKWGTKVYIIGYPLNNKMITSGLVSPSSSKERDYFFVDAVFNRGFSGGVVLAARDGAPNFELVGMVKAGTVHRNFNLKPNVDSPDFVYLPLIPYSGEMLVEEEKEIKYGVTKIMTIEKIIDFLDNKKDDLMELGYAPEYFLKK